MIAVVTQAFVVVGDFNGHIGLGVKCAKEVNIGSVASGLNVCCSFSVCCP